MKKIFLVTSILMLALCFSSVSFAELSDMLYKTDLPELSSAYDSLLGSSTTNTSEGSRTTAGTTASRPSTNSSAGSRPSTNGSIGSRPSSVSSSSSTELELIEVTISDILVGRTLPSSFKSKTNLDGAVEQTFQVGTESNGVLGEWDPAITTTATQNTEYTFKLKVKVPSTVVVSNSFKAKINGNECEFTRYGSRSDYYYQTSYTFKTGSVTIGGGSRPDASKEITEIKFTLNAPEYGKELDRNPVAVTDGIEFDHIYWSAKDITPAGGWVGLNNEGDKAEYATDYQATIFFKVKEGYVIKGVANYPTHLQTGVVNDESGLEVTYLSVQPHNIKTQTFTVTKPTEETKPEEKTEEVEKIILTNIDVEVANPEVGKALPATYTVKSNLVDKATEYKVGEEKEDNLAKWTPEDKEVKPGTKYTFKLEIALKNSMAEISKDLKITINQKEVKPTVKDGIYTVEYDFETEKPIEEKLYNHFEFEIAAPKIGEKPATTAKALSEKYKVTKVEWLTKDEKFAEGETYKVQIHFELIDKNVRSDYFATINGEMADLPNGDENYQKNTMYAEFTFPTLRDESKKVSWSNASAWALDELSKASNKGLIPQVLDKGDLKQNVTRKEFAHIAVLLYEKLSGQGIFVTHAPFKDTDDVEIAKAYTVGITNGVSETEFAPDTEITREQMATMMARALEKAGVDTFVDLEKITKFVDDDEMHDWSRSAIYFMSSVEIIKGMGENRFGVKENASREQSIIIAVRSVEKFAK